MITTVLSRSRWPRSVVEQPAEFIIEESDAIVVAIAGQLNVPFHGRVVVHPHITEQEIVIPRRPGPDPEAARKSRRGYVRRVGIEKVEEGEKGTIRPPTAQPVEEGFVGPVSAPGLEADPLHVVIVAAIQDVHQDPLPGYRTAEQGPRSEREILEMGDAASQPRLVVTAIGVRREPGSLIAPSSQVLR